MPDNAPVGASVAKRAEHQLVMLSLVAIAVGLAGGAVATVFIAAVHDLEHLLFHGIPERLGEDHAPWWLVVIILVTGAVLTWAAKRLPGDGGHPPLRGLGFDLGPREVLSVTLAALASLPFGAVLGPEAPLTAIGTALGAFAFKESSQIRQVMMIVGAMAAIAAIFGNPIVVSVFLLEIALVAGPKMTSLLVLVPSLVGMGASYVLQVGFANWSGLGEVSLSLPDLPAYPGLRAIDLLVAIPVAAITALVTLAARLLAHRTTDLAKHRGLFTIVGAALVTAAAAISVEAITGQSVDVVLFSGQSSMPEYMGITSASTLVVILIGKLVAYGVCMGGGFRGGPIFPAVTLGFLVALTAALMVDSVSMSAVAAAGLAAGTAFTTKLPFMSALLAVMLVAAAGGAVTVLAIVGTVVGIVLRMVADRHLPVLAAPAH